MAYNGISTLSTKQARQTAKLAEAGTKRALPANQGGGRRSTLDTTQLPSLYSGNTVVDNANAGGLIPGRPWT